MGCFIDRWFYILVLATYLRYSYPHSDNSLLLLISFDGFRHDYLEKVHAAGKETPNFDMLTQGGVRTNVVNTFVTKTFPNHYTIATGMYEENHGVVGNQMYDPVLNKTYNNSPEQKKDPWWFNNGTAEDSPSKWPGEPIWLRNENGAGSSLFPKRSGVYFWPGSENPLNGQHPFHYKPFNSSVPFDARVDTVVQWFADDKYPINFGALYFEEPDVLGHAVGPNSDKIIDKIVELDALLGRLIHRLTERNLLRGMNIIMTSDHGMTQINDYVYLDDYVNSSFYDHYGYSPVYNIVPKEGKEEKVYEGFLKAGNLSVFKKEDIPRQYHYTYNRRILPIVVAAKPGYGLCLNKETCARERRGDHGFNNSFPEMHPFFIAHGPAFAQGLVLDHPINNVDIYSLMCHILHISTAQHDGDFNNIKHVLALKGNDMQTMVTFLVAVGFSTTVAGVCCVTACRAHRRLRHRPRTYRISGVALSNVLVNGGREVEAKKRLLSSDEEEIP